MKLIEPLNIWMRTFAILFINHLNEEFFIERTVGELLFDGYPDTLTKTAPLLNPKIPYQPSFGWMYDRNETTDGLFSVNTGKTDISMVNALETLDGSPELSFWSGHKCNSLSGAKNGELFNPIASTSDSLLFFRTDLCRVWQMVYGLSHKSRFGDLSVYRYYPSDNTFANFTDYPPNSCYKPNENLNQTNHLNVQELDLESLMSKFRQIFQNDSVFESFVPKLKKHLSGNCSRVQPIRPIFFGLILFRLIFFKPSNQLIFILAKRNKL